MLGWTLLFALIFLISIVLALSHVAGAASDAMTAAAGISGFLLLLSLVTRIVRTGA